MASMVTLFAIFVGLRIVSGITTENIVNGCGNTYPSSNDIIICTNSCDNCNVICNPDCHGIKVYSGAFNTNIQCSSTSACHYAEIYVGDTGNYPDSDFDGTLLARDKHNFTKIVCESDKSCKEMTITIKGVYAHGGLIDLIGSGLQMFAYSEINVNMQSILDLNGFRLKCGENSQNCENVKYACFGVNCICQGSCGGIMYHTQSPSLPSYGYTYTSTRTSRSVYIIKYTTETLTPTHIPSENPSIAPAVTPTDNPTIFPTKTPSISPSISPVEITSTSPTDAPTIYPTNKLNDSTDAPTNIPSTFGSETPTISPTHNPILGSNITSDPTRTPHVIVMDNQTHTPNESDSLIWIILFSTTLSCCMCCLLTILIIFYRNKFKSRQKESDIMENQPSSQPEMTHNNQGDSIEIIEGIPITVDGIQAEYEIKALQNATIYLDKQKTLSYDCIGEGGINDIPLKTPGLSIESPALPNNIETTPNGDTDNEIELVYTKN